jgi:hypothetical protein
VLLSASAPSTAPPWTVTLDPSGDAAATAAAVAALIAARRA